MLGGTVYVGADVGDEVGDEVDDEAGDEVDDGVDDDVGDDAVDVGDGVDDEGDDVGDVGDDEGDDVAEVGFTGFRGFGSRTPFAPATEPATETTSRIRIEVNAVAKRGMRNLDTGAPPGNGSVRRGRRRPWGRRASTPEWPRPR